MHAMHAARAAAAAWAATPAELVQRASSPLSCSRESLTLPAAFLAWVAEAWAEAGHARKSERGYVWVCAAAARHEGTCVPFRAIYDPIGESHQGGRQRSVTQ